MNATKLRAILEDVDDLGLLVLTDRDRAFYIRNSDASPLAFYQVDEAGEFHHGWVETTHGRVDFTIWADFYNTVRTRAKKVRT